MANVDLATLKKLQSDLAYMKNHLSDSKDDIQFYSEDLLGSWYDSISMHLKALVRECLKELSNVLMYLDVVDSYLKETIKNVEDYNAIHFDEITNNTDRTISGGILQESNQGERKYNFQEISSSRWKNGIENFDLYCDFLQQESVGNVGHTSYSLNEMPCEVTSSQNIHEIDSLSEEGFTDHFWEMHGRTHSDYLELASHIPEVQERLDAGENLDDIVNDERIGACARLYFQEENRIVVSQYRNTYLRPFDGRHRILAAQELGLDIPIRIREELYTI